MKEVTTFRLPLVTIENINDIAQMFSITKSEVVEYALANIMYELRHGSDPATSDEVEGWIKNYFKREITK